MLSTRASAVHFALFLSLDAGGSRVVRPNHTHPGTTTGNAYCKNNHKQTFHLISRIAITVLNHPTR